MSHAPATRGRRGIVDYETRPSHPSAKWVRRHATLPVILAWAQRDIRGLRVAAPIWAGVTILATPLFGGHYGVDVLAGLLLAGLAIPTARVLVMRQIGTRTVGGPTLPLR